MAASIHKLPTRVIINCSPDELRKLADKMEAKIAKTALGESCTVEVWTAAEIEIEFQFDQEAAAQMDMSNMDMSDVREGDVLSHPEGAVTVRATRYDPCFRQWLVDTKERGLIIYQETVKVMVRRNRFPQPWNPHERVQHGPRNDGA